MASRKQPYLALCLQSALVFLEGICGTSLKHACLGEFCVFAGLPEHTTVCEAAERCHTHLKTPGDGRTGPFLTDGRKILPGWQAGCRMSTRGRCGHLIIHHHKYVELDFFLFCCFVQIVALFTFMTSSSPTRTRTLVAFVFQLHPLPLLSTFIRQFPLVAD